ncbi:Fic family protein [Maridesulfovibrio ferrireducens]|uniref:Fic family protein n=1 Tax=Maridesulfovibrio ferrireducens TaxID=246191 RepID=UPI001A26422F|nr:Fic family protein [Maridesulfovibrio ferrireducens]MBI9111487.1 Fic family protein [Maridesulfovibrio ferrireducens]
MNTQNLDILKSRLDAHRPLPPEVVKNLREDLSVRWTYNSNAIEGNTLTLQETKVVLEGITVGGKSIVEHLEAINHAQAINLVYDLAEQGELLSVHAIKEIHSLILKSIDDKNAGAFRTVNVTISGAEHVPPSFLNIQDEMDSFMNWCEGDGTSLHVVECTARGHVDFVKIHPFADGNGRTARLLMNLELMKGGFPPVVFQASERLAYYEGLEDACVKSDYESFLETTERLVVDSFKPYWFALGLSKEGL